jgi:hypothetical protein
MNINCDLNVDISMMNDGAKYQVLNFYDLII